jgi:ribosomal protein S12 methylthiotransferase
VGRTVRVLVERPGEGVGRWHARAPWQADDIDGVVHVAGALAPGAFADVRITQVVDDFDFHAELLRVADAPAGAGRRPVRALPLVGEGPASAGSYGR